MAIKIGMSYEEWQEHESSYDDGDEEGAGGGFPVQVDVADASTFNCLPRGSTHPHEGWINGRHYVLKCGGYSGLSSDEHVHNEFVADEFLRKAGCRVPASKEYRADIGHGKIETIRLAEYIENGRTLTDAYENASPAQRALLVRQIIDTYPAISFVDGTDTYQHSILDNVLVDQNYNLWFIDNGASFDFRARGLKKNWFWSRIDVNDPEHGYFAIRNYANGELKKILKGVDGNALRDAARRFDFSSLIGRLPPEYQQNTLKEYAKNLDEWSHGGLVQEMKSDKEESDVVMKLYDCVWLEEVSLQIAKAVRRIDKFIYAKKPDKTKSSRTMQNYYGSVDVNRLQRLAVQDPSGRVSRLLSVCDDIANSESTGFTVPVLAELWNPTADSTQRIGRKGNVEFSEYAFSRKVFENAGGVVEAAATKALAGNIEVVCGKVEETVADAVVNAANEHLAAGSGICGAIFRRAGRAQLQAACDKVAPCPTGEARITPAFGIGNAKFIVHAVGPRWQGGNRGEPQLLANCYRNLLKTAIDKGCLSIAIPSISTGVFGYPLDAAIEIAVREVREFVEAHPNFKVIFVVWNGDPDGGKSTKDKYLKALGKA